MKKLGLLVVTLLVQSQSFADVYSFKCNFRRFDTVLEGTSIDLVKNATVVVAKHGSAKKVLLNLTTQSGSAMFFQGKDPQGEIFYVVVNFVSPERNMSWYDANMKEVEDVLSCNSHEIK